MAEIEQLYELTGLIQPGLKENEIQDFNKNLEVLLSEKAKILKTEAPKKLALCYPIKKQNEAFLTVFLLEAQRKNIIGLKKELDKQVNILRFLIIKKEKLEEKPALWPEKPITEKKKTKIEDGKEKPSKTKIEIENIERDLEKILDFQSEDEAKPR